MKKRSISITKTHRLMVLREISTIYSKSYMKPISTLCEQNAELFNVKTCDA
jgi:hypothetical protein